MFQTYGDRATFVTVYIKEAHATDEWQMKSNETDNVCYAQPRTMDQRLAIANDFAKRFNYAIPMLVDGMDNAANQVYAGWPERIYVIDEQGSIVYKGEKGPFGFHPEEVETWLRKRFAAAGPAVP